MPALLAAALLAAALLLDRAGRPRPGGAPDVPPADYDASAFPVPDRPLLGAAYTHHDFAGCEWDGRGLLATWHRPGVPEKAHDQLRAMRAAGVESLRLLVWHMSDPGPNAWGVVPSRGGRLPEPWRSGLVALLAEMRRFGFARLTLSFGPQWSNSPLRDRWDPALFGQNRDFIADVVGLARVHGPRELRVDLMNEGAPSAHLTPAAFRRLADYDVRLWAWWVSVHGPEGATISAIAPPGPADRGDRLGNLLDALERAGAPPPRWFDVHVNYDSQAVRHGLRYADSTLSVRGLGGPLVVGETAYGDPAVGRALAAWAATSERELEEAIQWFRRPGGDCEVPPPYGVEGLRPLEAGGGT